jgi:aminomethyltransferase
MLKLTPLHAAHQKLGARLIEFGGWDMPVQYTGILDEHHAVRNAVGIFDISHMGEVFVRGAKAEAFLNAVLTNDIRKLQAGQGQYTILCNERGGAVDDLYAYRIGAQDYLLIINASRIDADVPWLESQLAAFAGRAEVQLDNASERMGAVAVQGPRAVEFIDACFEAGLRKVSALNKNEILQARFQGGDVFVSRTGYTGEDGFEVVVAKEATEALWNAILKAGQPFGLKPAGLGARDTLRTEVCYPLYGHELDENTTPIEAGLGWVVSFDKGGFNGRSVMAAQKKDGVSKKLVAFRVAEKLPPPRPHYAIWSVGPESKKLGEVSSGTHSPSLGVGIGMGYVPPEFSKPGTLIDIEIRGKRVPATVVAKPIYRRV